MSKSATRPNVPPAPQASHRLVDSQSPASAQLQLVYDLEAKAKGDEQQLAAMFAAAVRAFGGPDALRAALGEKDTYLTRVVDGMNGARPWQGRWLGPLLEDPRSAMIVLGYLSERAGFEPPVCHREVSEEETAKAALDVIAESGQLRETFRALIAKRLGVRPEQVKL